MRHRLGGGYRMEESNQVGKDLEVDLAGPPTDKPRAKVSRSSSPARIALSSEGNAERWSIAANCPQSDLLLPCFPAAAVGLVTNVTNARSGRCTTLGTRST